MTDSWSGSAGGADFPGFVFLYSSLSVVIPDGGGGGTPYNHLYGEAPPERGSFFGLQVYKRVGISQVEEYRRVGKSVI